MSILKRLFYSEHSEVENIDWGQDTKVAIGRARQLAAHLRDLLALPKASSRPDLVALQCGIILRLQQEVLSIDKFNLADARAALSASPPFGQLKICLERLEGLSELFLKNWTAAAEQKNVEETLASSLPYLACQFWILSWRAWLTNSADLDLAMMECHLLVAPTPRHKVVEAASAIRIFQSQVGLQMNATHWPFVDLDRVSSDYSAMVAEHGTFADQFLRELRRDVSGKT